MMAMRREVLVTIVAVSALAWPPARRLIADVLITVGSHLDHLDDPPGPSAAQRERMHHRFVDELADALVRRGRAGETTRTDTNGHRPTQPI